jgi:pyruvate kinase
MPSLTEKDLKDFEFGLKHNIDWLALSFVRHADDVHDLRRRIEEGNSKAKIISKIEKPEAIANIDEIIEASDAIMVARGDLGVEIFMEEVPIIQKMIAKKCKIASKPVIIATQMMESMIENPRPTRAETNDVANAVLDGADVLMLSGETSVGKYPIETVRSMSRTIQSVEENADIYYKHYTIKEGSRTFVHDSVISMAVKLAEITDAKAITGMTFSGYTGFRLAGHRPKSHIFIFTANKDILSTLNLLWGVRGIYYDKFESTDDTIEDLEKILVEQGYLKKGDVYINTASMPMYKKLRTNMVKLSIVE